MLRSLIVILFAFLFSISILTPSVIRLVDDECTFVTDYINENENQDNEDKELEDFGNEEKEVFLSLFANSNHSFVLNTPLTSNFYLLGTSTHAVDIQLPPPEHTI